MPVPRTNKKQAAETTGARKNQFRESERIGLFGECQGAARSRRVCGASALCPPLLDTVCWASVLIEVIAWQKANKWQNRIPQSRLEGGNSKTRNKQRSSACWRPSCPLSTYLPDQALVEVRYSQYLQLNIARYRAALGQFLNGSKLTHSGLFSTSSCLISRELEGY